VKRMSDRDYPPSEEEEEPPHMPPNGDDALSDDLSSDDEYANEPQRPPENPQMAMEELVGMRKKLEAQAAESDGVGLGTGSLFARPSPAELLRGASQKPPAQSAAHPAPSAGGGSRGGKHKGASQGGPAELTSGPPSTRPTGPIQHEGLLRKKKEDHGRFEDPYKTVCVCRLQEGVMRIRITQNGEVVGLEETYDLREWKLMPRQGKPDKFTIMRGVSASSIGGDSVLNLKADSKEMGATWIEHIQAAQDKARAGGFGPPQPAAAAPAPATEAGGVVERIRQQKLKRQQEQQQHQQPLQQVEHRVQEPPPQAQAPPAQAPGAQRGGRGASR